MAEFLATEGVSHALAEIVKRAQERLVLISPYLKVNPRIKEFIEDKNRLKIDIRIIYGKEDPPPEEIAWLKSMTSVRTSFCRNLHAKCYLNENEALLTSMNLYEFSQVNNYEMGILVYREQEPDLYKEILEESRQIERNSVENPLMATMGYVAEKPLTKYSVLDPTRGNARPDPPNPKAGFCIRCKVAMPTNPTRSYCKPCYTIWNKFQNKDYPENHCHACGKKHRTSFRKPLCRECFKKYPEFFKPRPAAAPKV